MEYLDILLECVEHRSINGEKCKNERTLLGIRAIHETEDKRLMGGTCTIEFSLM